MAKRLTPDQTQWNTCDACHPDAEGVVCNRGRGGSGNSVGFRAALYL
jgi:hypothetical protein